MSADTFCPLPWNHLATHPNGTVSLCCKADTTGLSGFSQTYYPDFKQVWRLSKVGLPTINNSDTFCQTRLDMLAGREPIACRGCFDVERAGGRSKRLAEQAHWPEWTAERAAAETAPNGQIKTQYDFLELRLGNACNLKCATCNPISSNQWQSDYDAIAASLPWVDQKMTTSTLKVQWSWPNTAQWVEDPVFWRELYQHSANCKKIYINGGEPMLNLQHIDFLRKFVADGRSKNVELIYSTNVTAIPKDVMHEVWAEFKVVEINASVDHVGEKNTHIRYPAPWTKIERTLAELAAVPNVNLTVIQTISAYNFLRLEEFRNWTQADGLRWWLNYVDHPDYLSVLAIDPAIRASTLARYNETLPLYIYRDLAGRYAQNTGYLGHDKFVQFNDHLDALRNTNWRRTFPELNEIFI
ncbi:MAG: twitch domain-containing radical SAM protein [Porticoccaceae bacterium]